jgi:hypothetical protein
VSNYFQEDSTISVKFYLVKDKKKILMHKKQKKDRDVLEREKDALKNVNDSSFEEKCINIE